MYIKELYFNILTYLVTSSAHRFDKLSFKESPGYILNLHTIETLAVVNKIQCVRACKRTTNCASINYKENENVIKCELNSESTMETDNLIEDPNGAFLSK